MASAILLEPMHSTRFATRMSRRIGEGTQNVIKRLSERRVMRDEAAVSLGAIGAVAMGTAAVIIGAVVTLILLANLFPSYSGAVGNLSDNLTTADWGDETANGISPTFAMLVSLGGLFAIVGLVFVAYKLHRGSS